MKTLPVVVLAAAVDDLTDISSYVLEVSQSLQTALDFTGRIEAKCLAIGKAPQGGAPRPDFGANMRMVPFEKSAVIFYRTTDNAVEIVRIFHGGQDYEIAMSSLYFPTS